MPLVYGFRQYQPRAQVYVHPFTGAVIATPVLDLSSDLGPQGYSDRSGTGANGVPVGGPVSARGVFDEAIKFGGVRDTLNCGSNAPLDIAGDISGCIWMRPQGVPAGYIMSKTNNASGWQFIHNGVADQRLVFYTYNGPFAVTSAKSVYGAALRHCAFSCASNIARIFIDGLQDGRGVVSMTDAAAESLWIASWRNIISWSEMTVELPQLWSGALSPERVYQNYLQAKNAPVYYDTFEGYAVTPVAKAVGSRCGPYRVLSNSLSVVADAAQQHWVQGGGSGVAQWPDNDAHGMWEFDFRKEQDGTAEVYLISGDADGAWNAATQNGYAFRFTAVNHEIQLWRITGGALTVALLNTAAGFLALNTSYRIRVIRRVGGTWNTYIKGGAYVDWMLIPPAAPYTQPATDNTYKTGQFHAMAFDSPSKVSAITRLRTCERPASFPWEFSTGTYAGVVSGSTVWMRCLTAGVTYLPKDLDWQTAIFGLYKGADANVTDFLFVASEIGGSTFANQNGYVLRLAADESVQLIRTTGGVEAAPTAQTAAGYVALTTEYEFKITHNGTTNAYEFFIRGGAYANWTLMFAATLAIHTSSNYAIWDLDADDRATAPVFYSDLR